MVMLKTQNSTVAGGALEHVLLFPFPCQSHMTPILMLAELLANAGLRVTFLNTEHMQRCLLRLSPEHTNLENKRNFRFRMIADGLPENDPRKFLDFLKIEESMRTHSREAYKKLLFEETDDWPPVTCVIADGIVPMALDVAEEVGVPVILIRTSSPCGFWAFHHIPDLIHHGEVPIPEGIDLNGTPRGVPGMEGILRRRDLPGFCRKAKTADDPGLQFLALATTNTRRARGLILNTFEDLDGFILSHIVSLYPNTYAVGPLHTHLRSSRSRYSKQTITTKCSPTNSISVWEADRSCMDWLDAQPEKSVVYVSFGSAIMMTKQELLEFLYGLVNSRKRFLWVMRPDMLKGSSEGSLTFPPEVEEGVKARGCMVSWAPQEEVLGHKAVGCFLTHSGWSSTLESVVAGVPMICLPFFSDQLVTSRFVSHVWKVGLDMKDESDRTTVEKVVTEVMEGEKAEELRRTAGKMAEMAKVSVEEGGPSWMNLDKLVKDIKSMASKTFSELSSSSI